MASSLRRRQSDCRATDYDPGCPRNRYRRAAERIRECFESFSGNLVPAIASVNVTHLFLARGARRAGEFAVRAALGASRWRLLRQLLTETTLVAAGGGVLGIVMAYGAVKAVVAMSPAELPRASA